MRALPSRQHQKRYVINASVYFYGKKYKITLSLSDREKMNYPVLIGRKFLNKKFMVDVSQKNITAKGK